MAEPMTMATAEGPAALRRSPLAHLEERIRAAAVTGPRGVTLTERPFLTMVDVRVAPGSAAAARVERALGARLPLHCGGTAAGPHTTAVWLGPDEWLVVSGREELVVSGSEEGVVAAELRAALGADPGSVVDVSANRTTLELSGPSARQVLEKGCPLDLHPRAFGPGRAVSTTVGPVPLLLWRTGPQGDGPCMGPAYRLCPRSSYADYLARWLIDAMREFGGPEVP